MGQEKYVSGNVYKVTIGLCTYLFLYDDNQYSRLMEISPDVKLYTFIHDFMKNEETQKPIQATDWEARWLKASIEANKEQPKSNFFHVVEQYSIF